MSLSHGDTPPNKPSCPPYTIGAERWPGVAKLAEEAGEFQQVFGKLIATDGEAKHWDGSDLRARLIEEAGDLYAAVLYFAEANDLKDAVEIRAAEKLARFRGWHNLERAA